MLTVELLNDTHQFPTHYVFKYIVPGISLDEFKSRVCALFPEVKFELRASSGGKYSGVTFVLMMATAESVLEAHKNFGQIKGIITL